MMLNPRLHQTANSMARLAYTGPLAIARRWQHLSELSHLEDAPWESNRAMDRLRLRLLNEALHRAARHSPFYRELLGPYPVSVRSFGELARFPVTSKEDFTASGVDRAVPGSVGRRRTTKRTSGSSGHPYRFTIDLLYRTRHEAQRAFVYLRAGLARGSTIVELLPGTRRTMQPQFTYPTFRRSKIGYGGERLGEAVWAVKPQLLYGNRSHLLQVADELESLGRRLDVPFVCSSSETLHPVDKDCLVRAFSGRILEVYGSSEGGNIAFRSESEPWTILEPRVLVEVLDEHRRPVAPGEIGELVITTLTEPTSPLVRYATGDLAQLQSGSAMGASGLRLAALAGRSSDAVVDSRGRRVPFWAVAGPAFWVSDALARHVRRWRIHQSADLSVDVYVELAPGGVLSEIAPAVRHHLQSILGPLPARVTRQNRVHDPVTGKFRAVTSDALVRRDSIDRRS